MPTEGKPQPELQTAESLRSTRDSLIKNLGKKNAVESQAEKLRRMSNPAEILKTGPRDAEELIGVIESLSYDELRKYQLEKKSGIKNFLGGEFDTRLDEEGQAHWNVLAEAGRKVLYSVFNRRTIAATGTAAVLGLLTGGVGWAAGGVIFGSMTGRAISESISFINGKERGAREEVMRAEKEQWQELKKLAVEYNQATGVQEKADLMTQITEIYYRQGETSVIERLKLAEEAKKNEAEALNKSRRRWQTVGELLGGAAGVAHGFLTGRFAAIDIDLWNKIDGQAIAQEVIKVNNVWHFAYSPDQWNTWLGGGQAVSSATGQILSHALGEPTWKIAAATAAERIAPVFLAALSAGVFGGKAEERNKARQEEYQERKLAAEKGSVKESIPQPMTEEKLKTSYEKMSLKLQKGGLPEAGELWVLPDPSDPKKSQRTIKILSVDWTNPDGPEVRCEELLTATSAAGGEAKYRGKTNYKLEEIIRGWSHRGPNIDTIEATQKGEQAAGEKPEPGEPKKDEAEKMEKEVGEIEKETNELREKIGGKEVEIKITRSNEVDSNTKKHWLNYSFLKADGEEISYQPRRHKIVFEDREYRDELTKKINEEKNEHGFIEAAVVGEIKVIDNPKKPSEKIIAIGVKKKTI